MASKSQIFEFLHHSLNFGAFFIVLICDVDFVEIVVIPYLFADDISQDEANYDQQEPNDSL